MSDIAIVPLIAEDSNYDAGSYAWSGSPTKEVPNSSYQAKGWIPGQNIPAEFENYIKHALKTLAADAQDRAVVKPVSGGFRSRNTGGHYAWMPKRKALIGTETISSAFKLVELAADLQISKDTTQSTIGVELCSAVYEPLGATGEVGLFAWGANGGGNNIACVPDDPNALAVTLRALPTAGARYHGGCTDVLTGNAVMVSGGAGTTPSAYGWAYGTLTSLTWAAFPGWTPDVCTSVAAKPGQVRAFSKTQTAYSNTGGAAPTVEVVTWTGGGAPVGPSDFISKPTWDARNNRWLCASADLDDYLTASPQIWTSTNGKDWTYLTDGGYKWLFAAIEYHKGWLWAIAATCGTHDAQPGFRVLYSKDGGATWIDPAIVLNLDPMDAMVRPVSYPNTFAPEEMAKFFKITPCGDSILFQAGGNGPAHGTLTGMGTAYRVVWIG